MFLVLNFCYHQVAHTSDHIKFLLPSIIPIAFISASWKLSWETAMTLSTCSHNEVLHLHTFRQSANLEGLWLCPCDHPFLKDLTHHIHLENKNTEFTLSHTCQWSDNHNLSRAGCLIFLSLTDEKTVRSWERWTTMSKSAQHKGDWVWILFLDPSWSLYCRCMVS